MKKKIKEVITTLLAVIVVDIVICVVIVIILDLIASNITGLWLGSEFMQYWIEEVKE